MNSRERGFLLLSSNLGDPRRRPLTTAQLRVLVDRAWQLDVSQPDRELEVRDLVALGYSAWDAGRILDLLSQEDVLEHYLRRAEKADCYPITRVSEGYPQLLRRRLGLDSPGVLWAKGDAALLRTPMIALVGSRDLADRNCDFAREAGRQAALQGYTLVSGNARGADREAQSACLAAGGCVISVVADGLPDKPQQDRVLYLSEDCFDGEFSSQRALSRNRVIHALGWKTLVAQCSLGMGGTWDGTVKNLRFGWSDVFCCNDGSEAVQKLIQMGAVGIEMEDLQQIDSLQGAQEKLFDQ